MKIRLIKHFVLITILGVGCSKFNNNDTLLQIGQYKLSVAEYESEKTANKDRLNNDQLENKLIEEGFFFADAIENRYDTISIINKKLEYIMYDKVSTVNGLVWNKRVKPNLTISDDDIKDAYNKRLLEYSLEILFFPTKPWLSKYLGPNSKIETDKDFYSLKKRISTTEEIKFFQVRDNYPFYPLGVYTDTLLSMKKGDILGPLETSNGYYVVHIADIENIKQPTYPAEKPKIEKLLLQVLTEKAIWKSQVEIYSKADMTFKMDAISEVAPNFDKEKKEWKGKDKSMELMKYKYNGIVYSYTLANLTEYANCAPIIAGSLSNPDVIVDCLKNYMNYLYLFDEAEKTGITNSEDFINFKKQYQQKLFMQRFVANNILPKIKISLLETKNYYEENKNSFTNFETAHIGIYKFKNRPVAFEGYGYLVNQAKQGLLDSGITPTNLKGLVSEVKNLTVNISDTTINESLVKAILNMKNGDVSLPLDVNDESWVIYLSGKSGNSLIPFRFTMGEIKRILSEKKFNEIHGRILAELKAKYPLKINHLKKYTSQIKHKKNV